MVRVVLSGVPPRASARERTLHHFMTTTSFVKIAVVFSILRNALGTGEVPSGAVIAALAALLSLYVMAPVGEQIADAAGPAAANVDVNDPLADMDALGAAIEAGIVPLEAFLTRNSGDRERGLFLELARDARPDDQQDRVSEDDVLVDGWYLLARAPVVGYP